MQQKEELLLEIAALIEGAESSDLKLSVMDFLSLEELVSIKNSLLKTKENRPNEREKWYNEWVKKCGKE